MLSRGVALVAVCVLGVLLGTAAADDKSGKQKRADELFVEGRKLLEAGDQNAAAACEKFNEAIKLDPEAPGTMLNLGLCNELLQKYKTALYWFRKAQARAAETNLPDYETAAKDHTVTLKRDKVATIKITFNGTAPDGTKVKIDGEEVAPADYLAAEVDGGPHELTAGAPGKKNVRQQFTVEGRGGNNLVIDLVAGDNVTVIDRGAGRRKAAYVIAGGGIVLMGTATLLSYLWMKEYDKCGKNSMVRYNDDDPAMGVFDACPERQPTAAKDYAMKYKRRVLYGANSIFVAGVAAVGVAAFLYFTAPDKERVESTVFAPTVGPDQVGFAVSGGF